MPIERKAWACQYKCGTRVRTKRSRIEEHEKRCWRNPERRACVSCDNFSKYDDDNGMGGTPYLQTWRVSECAADGNIDLSEKLRHNCPIWRQAGKDGAE